MEQQTDPLEKWIRERKGQITAADAEHLRELVLSIMVQQYRRGFDHATGKDRLVAA